MPHKYWGISSLTYIIEHIDFISWWRGWEPICRRNTGIEKDMTGKGNKKGNNPAQIADFADPPWGGRFPLAGAWAQRPTSVLTSENFLRC